MSGELLSVLQGCLYQETVHTSEGRLKQMSEHPEFTQQLLLLVPNQESNILIMVLTTLKNYLLARYNSAENRVIQSQKQILRSNLLDLYYEIKNNTNAIKLYKEVLYIVILVDYPWASVDQSLSSELNGNIEAGVYFCRQVTKANEWYEGNERQKLQVFINNYFPRLEQIVEQILSNFNEATGRLLEQILKTFYSAFHISIPVYLRDFARLQRWILFFNTILNVPTEVLSAKSQQIVARIYLRLFSVYCNDIQDGKSYVGWAQQFRKRYASQLLDFTYQLVSVRKGNEDILSSLINCLHEVVKKQQLKIYITNDHVHNLFYGGILLPLCESSKEELQLFQTDQIEYVRRQDDLTCYPIRRAVLDLIEMATNCLVFNDKRQLMRMVQYSAAILSSTGSSDGEKQVVIRILSKIGKLILRNNFLKDQFQNLTVQYFQPLLRVPNKLINSLICELLALYLPFGHLSSPIVNALMEQIYAKIIQEGSLVVRYNSILAFTALLGHSSALEAAKPHFQSILQIYVKTLNNFDHQNLLQCLETIVKHFNQQIVAFAPDLLPHLLRMFCSLAKNDKDEEEDEPDTNSPASAALSTVKQILNCTLSPQVYHTISIDLIELFRGIFGQYSDFFDEVLSLFAVLCYKAKSIADFQYPYAACRKLLQGDNSILQRSSISSQLLGELLKVQAADSEFQQSLIAILKNIIQKAPDQVLRNYPWPKHPELILALIENQRISPQELGNLNTSEVDAIWTPYLSAYSWVVFGVGGLTDIHSIKSIVGVSLYPWLKEGVNPQLIKLIVSSVDDQQDDQNDLIQENTAQLLEKYANEDDEDEEESYIQSTGKNYGFLYDSPFNSADDQINLAKYVRNLHQQDALNLANNLSNYTRKKLQILMAGYTQ